MATGHEAEAAQLVASLRARLDGVADGVAGRPRPRVLLLEWTDPPFAPGHWVPEMVTLAGGVPAIGAAGEKSVRVTWEQVLAGDPDVVVCAPCGYDLDGSAALAGELVASGVLPPRRAGVGGGRQRVLRAPGPRLVDGVEALAGILHPGAVTEPTTPMARRVR